MDVVCFYLFWVEKNPIFFIINVIISEREGAVLKLIISFSGRKNGNCGQIASHIAEESDQIVHFGDLDIHPCSGCNYQCFGGECPYRGDAVYGLYEGMLRCDKVILIVPMYCGNPSSLYFVFNERCQDYFMHNDTCDEILRRLYIIGVYGSQTESPEFIPTLEKWFDGSPYQNRVLGLQRHLYGQRMEDSILDIADVRSQINAFMDKGLLNGQAHRRDDHGIDAPFA